MKPLLLMAALVLTCTFCCSAVHAQWYMPYGGYGGYGYGGASTPQSAAGMAMGDIIRSQGMYNQMTSAAMVNVEQARSKFIDNQRQWTEVYQVQQRILASQHAADLEAARARNAKYQEYLANRPTSLPPRLDTSQVDSATGKINWPGALMRPAFATQRSDVEAILASRAHTGSNSELAAALSKKVREMHENLRSQIKDIVPQEYMDARKFLDSLSLEGRFPGT
jgi:hypothetical protein